MPVHTVVCPNCRAELRLKSPPPAETRGANCPRCRKFVPFHGPKAEDTASAVAGSGARDESTVDAPKGTDPLQTTTQVGSRDELSTAPTPRLAPPLQPDEIGRLGPYRVLAELGRGGMGVVFRAEDPNLARMVALKVMLPQHANNPTDKARFLREARAQAQVEHEHVAQIFQVGEANGTPYLAMPLLKGQSLAAALQANPRVPLAEAVRLGREMAEGLAGAHGKGLIHRDIKPANVWLEGKRRRVKILDFGLARAVGDNSAADTATADESSAGIEITRHGAIIGTPAYMSPEQAHGEQLDARSDLFSFGIVLYQLLAGRHPFRGTTATAMLIAVATEHPQPPSAYNTDVPPVLDALTMELLAKKPNGRPATADEVAARLRLVEDALGDPAAPVMVPVRHPADAPDPWENIDLTEELSGERPAPKPAPAERGRAARRAAIWGALAALAIVALASAAFWFSSGTVTAEFGDEEARIRFKSRGRLVLAGRGSEYALAGEALERRVPAGLYTARVENDPELILTHADYKVAGGSRVRVRVVMRPPIPSVVPPPPPPKPPTTDPERKAAEWALNCGGKIVVWVGDGAPPPRNPRPALSIGDWAKHRRPEETEITAANDLPKGRFVVTRIDLHPCGRSVTNEGFAVVGALKHLEWLDLFEANINDDSLALLKDMSELSVLTLQRATINDAGIKHLKNLTNLTYLNLSDRPISDDALQNLSGLVRLRTLVVAFTRVTGKGAEHLRDLPALREFNLHLAPVTAAGLEKVAELTELSELSLDSAPVQNGWLAPLTEMRALDTLFLSNNKRITDEGMLKALESGRLSRLVVTKTSVTAAGVAKAREVSPYTRIEWDGGAAAALPLPDRTAARYALDAGGTVQITGQPKAVRTASELPPPPYQLTGTDLSNNRQITDDGCLAFKGCRNLITLIIYDTPIGETGLAHFAESPNLISLWLRGPHITDAALAHFRNCKKLRSLHVADAPLTDAGLAFLADCPDLEDLWIPGCKQIGDAGAAHLAGCARLWRLNLHGSKLTDRGLEHLKNLKSIRDLEIPQTAVTAEGLAHLAGCTDMRKIDLGNCPGVKDEALAHFKACKGLQILWLGNNPITDAGMANLAECKNLNSVILSGTRISDVCLAQLQECRNLRSLSVRSTQVTRKGLDAVRAALPQCKLDADEVPPKAP